MDYGPLIEKKRGRYSELEGMMSEPGFYDDQTKAAETMREHAHLKKLLEARTEFEEVERQLADNRELSASGDEELAGMAAEEIPELERRVEELSLVIQYAILPREESEERDAILEIRAGTGGDEASLFAGDLLRMYTRHCEERGWKLEVMEGSPSDVGGFKEITVKVSGEEVFRFLKYESGVHRVQRVPATETQGRIHTSTATVAVLPEAEEVDIELKPDELRIEATRSSGPGGQHVNTTDSAVQILHIPTGIMVKCQDGRSQGKNKEKGLAILRAKLYERKKQEEAEAYSAARKNLIGSGGREEKVRTYNFPQNRVTDHRIGLTVHNLDAILDGQIDEMTEGLQAAEMAERLSEAGLS